MNASHCIFTYIKNWRKKIKIKDLKWEKIENFPIISHLDSFIIKYFANFKTNHDMTFVTADKIYHAKIIKNILQTHLVSFSWHFFPNDVNFFSKDMFFFDCTKFGFFDQITLFSCHAYFLFLN